MSIYVAYAMAAVFSVILIGFVYYSIKDDQLMENVDKIAQFVMVASAIVMTFFVYKLWKKK